MAGDTTRDSASRCGIDCAAAINSITGEHVSPIANDGLHLVPTGFATQHVCALILGWAHLPGAGARVLCVPREVSGVYFLCCAQRIDKRFGAVRMGLWCAKEMDVATCVVFGFCCFFLFVFFFFFFCVLFFRGDGDKSVAG